jgi:hypothetical protein
MGKAKLNVHAFQIQMTGSCSVPFISVGNPTGVGGYALLAYSEGEVLLTVRLMAAHINYEPLTPHEFSFPTTAIQ